MQDVIGILLMLTGAASGLLLQDPVVCRFTDSNQCYVALGKRLHLIMPQEDWFSLDFTDRTNTPRQLIKYRKNSNTQTRDPRWQFVNDNKTMILTSAERSDSGNYTLLTNDENGITKGIYNLQLNIEAEVSSVKVSYSCLSPGVMKVSCSADGENLHFNWTSDSQKQPQLENENKTLILNKTHEGNVTCHVENHVSRDQHTTKHSACPEPTTTATIVETTKTSSLSTLGTSSVSNTENNNSTPAQKNVLVLYYTLIILSSVCMLLIIVAIIAFYTYKKRQGQKNSEAPSQEDRELVYAQVTHSNNHRTETRPNTSRAQDEDVEYASVVTQSKKKKQKTNEDEVQYGELVFNTPAKKKQGTAKVEEDCVYSQVHRGQ